MTRRRGTSTGTARWRTPLFVAASLALHAGLLGPLAYARLGDDLTPDWDTHPLWSDPIEVVLLPRLPGEPSRGRTTSSPSDPFASTPVTEGGPAQSDALFRGGPVDPSNGRLSPDPRRSRSQPAASATASAPVIDDRRQAPPDDSAARIGTALRRGAAGCQMLTGRLDATEQARCDRLLAEGAARAAPITGTDDPRRDARFAAAGAKALADYERRRAPLNPNSRALPCPHGTDIMGGCPVRVIVPLWSSTEGFLPGLKRDDG